MSATSVREFWLQVCLSSRLKCTSMVRCRQYSRVWRCVSTTSWVTIRLESWHNVPVEQDRYIVVENLVKTYRRGQVKAVNGASFQVGRGEIFGLIGPNGAGKTTIMGCLLGLVRSGSGTISIDNKSPLDLDVKKVTGFLPERPSYNRWMTVHQFLTFHYMLAELPSDDAESEIKRVLSLVELDIDPKKRRVRELSRGMLQRVGLAQAFLGKPNLLFLDEPTAGMDPLGFILMRNILKKCKDEGITVILNSHHLHEVERVCDRVAFIRKGKIEYSGTVDDLSKARNMVVVHWAAAPRDESANESITKSLQRIADKNNSTMSMLDSMSANFAVNDKLEAAAVVSDMVQAGFKVFEVTFERKELVDLFLNSSEPQSMDPANAASSVPSDALANPECDTLPPPGETK